MEYMPHHPSPVRGAQNHSSIKAINLHAFKEDFVIAVDTGFDHIYHYGINEWQNGLQIIHSFERGFGPHSFDFDVRNNLMFVLGEFTPSVAVLQWDTLALEFKEIDRFVIIKPNVFN